MNTTLKLPFYAKFALISIGLYALIYALYASQAIILPVIYATIIAILLDPVVNFLTAKKVHKLVAISLSVILVFLIITAFLYFLSVQFSLFSETYPKLKEKFNDIFNQTVQWISVKFNVSTAKINDMVENSQKKAMDNMGGTIGQILALVNSVLISAVLIPVYLFMILYYKLLLLEFITRVFKTEHIGTVGTVLNNSKKIIQSYLSGLVLEAIIMAGLNAGGLLMLGIDYAIILGITGALLNIIPYIGGVIAISLPMIIALVTKDISSALMVMLVYLFIQFVDNNFIVPRIVASKVKINALVSIIVVLIFGALWGVAGMFLSIPLTAIIKVIFDNIETLKPWGMLLGNIVPTKRISFRRRKPAG